MSRKLFDKCVALSKDLAEFDANHSHRHYSFLCVRNKIVTIGKNNKWRTTTLANKYGHLFNAIHSEVDCIKSFKWNWRELPNFTMVNVRLNRHLDVMFSKPCKACQKVLADFEIGQVYYSNNDGGFEQFL